MKNYRNALAALVLAFVFSTSAFGEGILWTEKTPPPPPARTQAEGVIWTDIAAPATEEEDTLTEIALNLLQALIPLL
ncbi:MAG TPA: hypothetical protein VEY11_01730 [Pyrinomonadaceae bacterium]|nr:hypothetical protein [Pyrinomonadaceae bacterium]